VIFAATHVNVKDSVHHVRLATTQPVPVKSSSVTVQTDSTGMEISVQTVM